MKKLVTNNLKAEQLLAFKNSFDHNSNNTYYLYAANHIDNSEGIIPDVQNSYNDIAINPYSNMIFGKKINGNDVSLVVRNIPYESNRVYDMYDDKVNLSDKDFYTIVQEDELFHVYKCLDNNFNSVSTVRPQFSYVSGSNNYTFRTADDGYVWKYMTSLNETDVNLFATEFYFPLIENANVKSSAINGAIDIIAVDGEGRGYDNYLYGTFGFADLRINENVLLYRISNNSISHANGFYTGCMIYISEGSGQGQFKTITNYFTNSNGSFIEIDSEFEIPPVNGSEYEVYPEVVINGTGTNLLPAKARAIINAYASNSISYIEMLEIGKNYEYAEAKVIANSAVGVIAPVNARPIYSPAGGHGSDIYSELYAKTIIVSSQFIENENDTIFASGKYQSIGLLKNPLFANVCIELDQITGSYIPGEKVLSISPVLLSNGSVVRAGNNEIHKEVLTLDQIDLTQGGLSGAYAPTDVLFLTETGADVIESATLSVVHTEVLSVDINAVGNNYSNGDIVWLSTGSGTQCQLIVATNDDSEVTEVFINNPGLYNSNPNITNSPTDTNGEGSGLTLDITTRISSAVIQNPGLYKIAPTTVENNMSLGGGGSGAAFNLTFRQASNGSFSVQLKPGDQLYITDKEDVKSQIVYVDTVEDNSLVTLTSNMMFSCTDSIIYFANEFSNASVIAMANVSHILVSNVLLPIETEVLLVGETSGTKAISNTIIRNNDEKGFETFIQLYKYEVDIMSGMYVENETVSQNSLIIGTVHSTNNNGESTILYLSNVKRDANLLFGLIGDNSGTVGYITEKYTPEVSFGSGKILFIENVDPITRLPDQTEHFKLIFEI